MSKTGRPNYRRSEREAQHHKPSIRAERNLTVRSEKRTPPDLQKLSRALIAMGLAEIEAKKKADANLSLVDRGEEVTDDRR
jgi:hypothetical protein